MDGEELPAVDEVHILRLRPGDTVVIYLDNPLNDAEHADLSARLKKKFPGNEVLVLYGGRVEVLRRDDESGGV